MYSLIQKYNNVLVHVYIFFFIISPRIQNGKTGGGGITFTLYQLNKVHVEYHKNS